MARSAKHVRVIRIFVSSPGDVTDERNLLDDVAERINRSDGEERGARLELTKWENDVVPQVGPGPQRVVDSQTVEYDIYLGIMSTRFGTPTDGRGSGTEKELRDALKRWGATGAPWILFYFRDKPPLSSDPDDVEQYLEVCKFRKELQTGGIVGSYTAPRGASTAFFEQAEMHLREILKRIAPSRARPGRADEPAGSSAPTPSAAYRDWLRSQGSELALLGLERKKGQAVTLDHVYVPLTTAAADPDDLGRPGAADRTAPEERQRPRLLLDLLDRRSLYVSGAPGAGKSTFCRWVAMLACSTAMPDQPLEAPEGYAESFPRALAGRLPLLLRLREFWPYLPKTPGCRQLSHRQLEKALEHWLSAVRPGGLAWSDLRAHVHSGTALLLLDGADEVPLSHGAGKRPSCPRAMLLAGLSEAIPKWIEDGNRVLLTSRPYGIADEELKKLHLMPAPIDDLAPPVQELLISKWFRVLKDDPSVAETTAAELRVHVAGREDLAPLTANPMLLTAMCIIYDEGKRLPEDKADLYDRIVDNVLHNRFEDPAAIAAVRNRLCVVAHGMHTGMGLGEHRATPEAEATYDEIDRMLQAYRDQSSYTEPGFVGAVEAREDLLAETGILLPRENKRASFYHLSFQEFLAAERIVDIEEGRLEDQLLERSGSPEWRNTLAFSFGIRLGNNASPERCIRFAERLIDAAVPTGSLGLRVVVADCLEILLGRKIHLNAEFEQKFRRICLDAIESEVAVRERRHLAIILGRLSDPRLTKDPRDPAGYVEIPAGVYKIGEKRKAWTLEQSIWIGKYPVTNSWFAVFLAEGGYQERKWWSDAGWSWRTAGDAREPLFWRHGKWNAPNLPVVGVSFWEAEAFCKWIGGRLPTELEWEAAARGPEGYEYPWGNEWEDGICNSFEADVGATTPVGIFPRSASKAFGLQDMAGNVFEWTEHADEGQDSRVLRGGSWGNLRYYARAAARLNFYPWHRYYDVGFRVSCSSPISVPSDP